MKRIITIQHTQSVHHTNGMVGSWTDWELTEMGRSQAESIGRMLASELSGRKYVMYTSDLKRARETAVIVASHLHLQPIERKELRERNLGACCGKSVEWMRSHAQVQEHCIDDKMFPDAESRREEWERLRPFFNEIMHNDEENIIIVSHGDLLGVFNAMFMRMNVRVLNSVEAAGLSGGVSVMLENNEGKRFVKKISDLSYVNYGTMSA